MTGDTAVATQRGDYDEVRKVTERDASGLCAQQSWDDVRSSWRALVGLPTVRTMMETSIRGVRGDGAVAEAVAVLEGLGRVGVPPGLVYALSSQVFGIQWPLAEAGILSPDAALGSLAAGILDGTVMLCHALTEETGGSDPLSMRTSATLHPDGGYALSGRKAFITAAPVADVALVFARTAPGRQPFALTAFLLPTDRDGVRRSKPFPKRALTAIPMGAIDFDDVGVGANEAITDEGGGLALLTSTTAWERALLMAYSVGVMKHRLARIVEWASARTQFDRALGASPLAASRIADMSIIIHRIRTLVLDMAARIDRGERISALAVDAARVKVSCAQDLLEFETLAAKIVGARSVVADSGLDVELADAVAASIYAGGNDLLRVSIARDLDLPVEN